MNRLSIEKRVQVLSCLVEGNSIRSTCRITGVSKATVTKLLVDVGEACERYQRKTLVNLPCKKIQCDEIWTFCYAREKNVPKKFKGQQGYGDVWTWVAICPETKLVPVWRVGNRGLQSAYAFIGDLSKRFNHRIQIITDGHSPYLDAIEQVYGTQVDYSRLVKIMSKDNIPKVHKENVIGESDERDISTSYIERQNLTMRMNMRRFTRRTNAFSKKVKNMECAVALHFMHYNFCRIHQSIRVTPAIEAGVTDHVWSLEELLSAVLLS